MAFAVGAPAQAAYERVDFSGTILAVDPGTPAGFGVGTPVMFEAVYDPANLIDRTKSVNAGTGLGFASVLAVSLADDPNASLSIKVGPTSFSKFDQINYGTPEGDCGASCDLGQGDFPVLTFLNGTFAGVGNFFVNSAGYAFDADPIVSAFGGFDLGDGNGAYGFYLGQSVNGNPFATDLAVGNYDASSAVFSAVPEPSVGLALLGIACLAGAARRRHAGRGAARMRLAT